MKPFRGGLLWKLLAINVPIVVLVIVVMWLAIDYLAADYFSTLMERYNISPSETNQMFLDAVHRYLVQASIAAVVLAVGLSAVFTQRALRPLTAMAQIAGRIAEGDFAARVDIGARDEVGRLGEAFNRMADSLARLESLRRTMVADFAHELRTPLTNIRGYLEGLAEGVIEPSPETFDMLHEEVLRLVRLIEGLQQLTKVDAARILLERRSVALEPLLGRIVDLNRPRAEARGVCVETTVAPDAARIDADTDKLALVLGNLADNACRYTPPAGRVRIDAARAADSVRVSFRNPAPQLGADDLPMLFERFWRADKSRSRDSGGAGIGLAIVKDLVEAHGGTVGAASDNGELEVWFTLPDAAAP